MSLFYASYLNEKEAVLNEKETHHCAKVLRKNKGDIISITNGRGVIYEAKILQIEKKNTFLKIISKTENYNKRNYRVHIAIAPTKNIDRFEFFLEKATEIGIDEISPIICKNSERKIIKPERLTKQIESALKQSFTAYMPKLNEITKYEDFIKKDNTNAKYIAHCKSKDINYLGSIINKQEQACVVIGPEGDFTEDEINLAVKTGFTPVSLGSSRLRTETAGIIACSIIANNNYN